MRFDISCFSVLKLSHSSKKDPFATECIGLSNYGWYTKEKQLLKNLGLPSLTLIEVRWHLVVTPESETETGKAELEMK